MKISRDYGVLIEEEGITLRGLFLIDPKGILRSDCCGCLFMLGWVADLEMCRQITVNDLPVGRSVEETICLIKAFQFAVRPAPFLVSVLCYQTTSSFSQSLSTLIHYAYPLPFHLYRTNMGKSVLQTGTRVRRR